MNGELVRNIFLGATALVALVTAYYQFFRFRGAKLVVLDKLGNEPQKCTIMTYSNLPHDICNQFPDYHDVRGYHAIIRIPFANEGDRAGYVKILDVRLQDAMLQGPEARARVRFSYYTYCVVPAFGIGLHAVLLRNLPLLEADAKVRLELDMELGRVHPLRHKHDTAVLKSYALEIYLKAPNPELIQVGLENSADKAPNPGPQADAYGAA